MSITLSFYAIILQMYDYLIIPANTFPYSGKNVGCGMFNVGCMMWDVQCWIYNVGCMM
jgi:hypothetical protein